MLSPNTLSSLYVACGLYVACDSPRSANHLVDRFQPACTLVDRIQPACTLVDQQDTIFLAQGCQTTSSSSEPQFTWGISRIRSFWFRMQNQFQYFRAASFNPFVSTTTPPYYSLTTYHLRQIYASTVALKTALKRRRWLRRLTPTSNTYEQIGTITVQLYRYVY